MNAMESNALPILAVPFIAWVFREIFSAVAESCRLMKQDAFGMNTDEENQPK